MANHLNEPIREALKHPERQTWTIGRSSARAHADGMELLFERAAESLQAAISSAISNVEGAEFRVSKVELQREAIRS